MLAVSSSNGSGSQGVANKQIVSKFNPQKMPVTTNYVHRISGGGPIDGSRVNELLLESQKMIYAPPPGKKQSKLCEAR